MPLPEFARYVAHEAGISIVTDERLDRLKVNIEAVDQPVEDLLAAVARRSGVQLNRSGSLYYLGSLRREDKGVLVRRVHRLDQAGIAQAVQPFTSELGQVASFNDGLLIVGDRVEVLERIHDVIDQIEQAETAVWCLQFYLVSLSDSDVRELGIDTAGSINVATTFAASSGVAASAGALAGSLDAVIRYAKTNAETSIVAEPLFYLSDGESARMFRGEKVPVQRVETRNLEGQARESITVEFVPTGLAFEAAIRELSSDAATLDVRTEISAVTGQGALDAPIISEESYNTQCVIRSDGCYLLGAIERCDSSISQSHGLSWGGRRNVERRTLQIWCRCQKVHDHGITGSSSLIRSLPEVQ